jgi:hypothetical protein
MGGDVASLAANVASLAAEVKPYMSAAVGAGRDQTAVSYRRPGE